MIKLFHHQTFVELLKKHLFLVLFTVIIFDSRGQSESRTTEYFDQLIGLNSLGLINGAEYTSPRRAKKSHAFYNVDEWQNGNLFYRGQLYKNVPMKFELVANRIAIQKTTNTRKKTSVAVQKEHLEWFEIDGNIFRKVKLNKRSIYVQEHYAGERVKLYETHRKKLEVNQNTYVLNYESKNELFLKKGTQIAPFKGKKDIVSIFPDKKKLINNFIRSNKLKVNSKSIGDINRLLEYCEGI